MQKNWLLSSLSLSLSLAPQNKFVFLYIIFLLFFLYIYTEQSGEQRQELLNNKIKLRSRRDRVIDHGKARFKWIHRVRTKLQAVLGLSDFREERHPRVSTRGIE